MIKKIEVTKNRNRFSFDLDITNVNISSNPTNATVSFDNRSKVGITPITMKQVGFGKHNIKLSKNGYKEDEMDVNISREYHAIEIDLQPIYGSLLITSTPKGAEIFIEGKSYGKTPRDIPLLAMNHHITLRFRDKKWETHVEVKENQKRRLTHNFYFKY